MKHCDIVVNILTGKVGSIVERYHPTRSPHYADWRVWFFEENEYWIVRERHLRKAMFGEKRQWVKFQLRRGR